MPQADTVKVITIVANSPESFDAAVKNGVASASKSLRGISGIKVHDMSAKVTDNQVTEYRVTMEVAFKLEG